VSRMPEMWESQTLTTLSASTVYTGITLPYLYIKTYKYIVLNHNESKHRDRFTFFHLQNTSANHFATFSDLDKVSLNPNISLLHEDQHVTTYVTQQPKPSVSYNYELVEYERHMPGREERMVHLEENRMQTHSLGALITLNRPCNNI
jgi:hypothetical protein